MGKGRERSYLCVCGGERVERVGEKEALLLCLDPIFISLCLHLSFLFVMTKCMPVYIFILTARMKND